MLTKSAKLLRWSEMSAMIIRLADGWPNKIFQIPREVAP
jgi:hypothetical protein